MEEKLRINLWIFEGKILELSHNKLNESQEDAILSELSVHSLEYNKFKTFIALAERLKCLKYLQKSSDEKNRNFYTWFTDVFQKGIRDHLDKVKSCKTLDSLDQAKSDKCLILKLVNLKDVYESRENKIKNPPENEESSSSSSEDESGSSSSSDSEESGEESVSQGISVDSESSVDDDSISVDDNVSDSSS